jgi:hypothetical protein
MSSIDRLRALVATEWERLGSGVPSDHSRALSALVGARDERDLAVGLSPELLPAPDGEGSSVLGKPGWNRALQLCLASEPAGDQRASRWADADLARWADDFLVACRSLGEAELVLAQCEADSLQLHQSGERTFDAWHASSTMPTDWRERLDFAWWSAMLARRVAPRLIELVAARPDHPGPRNLGDDIRLNSGTDDPGLSDYFQQLGQLHVRRMANQWSYPSSAMIGGVALQRYVDLLALLIGWLLHQRDRSRPASGISAVCPETVLVEAVASALAVEPVVARAMLRAVTLDAGNAAYHAAVPDGPAPPLIRNASDQLVWSAAGLLTTPILFLARELKHRHARDYHDNARLREEVFRRDLHGLFPGPRFSRSSGPVELRRADGDARTDLDALVFDRKSGTLAIFELKAQDPFPRSADERARQRDNFFYANKQVAAIAQWLQRNDATELLARFDRPAARTFRVQRVYLFVLGRNVAHFADGPAPDRRVAWGSWPRLLRLLDERPLGLADANPLGSLHARLVKDTPLSRPADRSVRETRIGDARLAVHPSFAAFKESGRG